MNAPKERSIVLTPQGHEDERCGHEAVQVTDLSTNVSVTGCLGGDCEYSYPTVLRKALEVFYGTE